MKIKLPYNAKKQAEAVVFAHNEAHDTEHIIKFRDRFAYLSRIDDNDSETKIGRFTYSYSEKEWGNFAVYKYSEGRYDPDDFMFPGGEEIDDSIESVLDASFDIYPESKAMIGNIIFVDKKGNMELVFEEEEEEEESIVTYGFNPLGCLIMVLLSPLLLLRGIFRFVLRLFR